MSHKFDLKNLHKLEERLKLMPPEEILSMIHLRIGETFLDIGSGPGGFTIPAAKMVGETGKVIALDVSAEILEMLSERVKNSGMSNIDIVLSQENNLSVPDESGDVSFLCMVLHEVIDPAFFLAKVFQATRKGGRIAVIEWMKKPMEKGPPLEDRLESEQVISALENAGFHNVTGEELFDYFFMVTGTK